MNLSPLIAGAWDGCSAWLQWTPSDSAPLGYLVRVRLRPKTEAEWGKWIAVSPTKPFTKAWASVQMVREGWQMQAQVAVKEEVESGELSVERKKESSAAVSASQLSTLNSQPWQTATEVTFARCTARFTFERAASVKAIEVIPGTIFSAMVDLAGCSYIFTGPDPLILQPGTTTECEMEAVHLSAWCQLDAPGDFLARPVVGLTVTNTTPSVNDVTPTDPPRDWTLLAKAHPGGPGVIVPTGRKWALPN